ncbi:tetratricopeptide (TPR) repeat protein [Parvibaculum indicum]|uniref:tetratricopeptide repeat-containing sulfotransferase family protein n=1 Tax=Parvibaculum indicum TaxID=562969 RepID=UPI0014244EB6|nr:sulfotransferase [Parvibaculum indicum]NIJ43296.1 tetratricopeptide (TPR) repeat protein [Parvibaculum indicum]
MAIQQAAALYGQGRMHEAAEMAQRILKADPEYPDALHLLGLILYETGKAADGEKFIRQALDAARKKKTPVPASLWINLGNARRAQQKYSLAEKAYDEALKLDPRNQDACLERGILNQLCFDHDAALADFTKAIEIDPQRLSAYLRAAQSSVDAGRFRKALELCDIALARLDPPPAELTAFIGMVHERLSELDLAIEWTERALASGEANATALKSWAKASRRKFRKDTERLREIRSRLEAADFSQFEADNRRALYAELGLVCDDLGDADAAVEWFSRQNKASEEFGKTVGIDPESYVRQVDGLHDAFTPEFVASWSPVPGSGKRAAHRAAPVFLVGFPRSGTTLLDQIFDAHPDVQALEERPTLVALVENLRAKKAGYPGSLASLSEKERDRLSDLYYEEAERHGVDFTRHVVVDKMPLDLVHAGLIHRVFPDAKFIFALRHPAACVLSCFMQDFVPNASMLNFGSIERGARLYDKVMRLWGRYREVLPIEVQEVRYENLITDLRGEVEPALEFIGLGWDEAVSDPAAHARQRGSIRTPSYAQVTEPIYNRAAERWRRYEKYLEPALPLLKPHIERFGYSL